MRSYIIVLALLVLVGCITGCSTFPEQPPQALEVLAETVETVEQNSTSTNNLINNIGMDWKTLLLFTLLAGWAIPSPSEMVRGLFGFIKLFKWW